LEGERDGKRLTTVIPAFLAVQALLKALMAADAAESGVLYPDAVANDD